MKFTLLIALLNDAARTQIRKGDSDDLSDHHSLRTRIHIHTLHTPPVVVTALLRIEISPPKMLTIC